MSTLDSTLVIDLTYARTDNFLGRNLYGSLQKCYLQPEAARMLARAHAILKQRAPGLRILVADGARPRRIQERMWAAVRGTPRQRYVASPSRGSMHNYGAAVDVTLIDASTGRQLDMGTPLDDFTILAAPREEDRLLRAGRLTREQVARRRLLRSVMTDAGFRALAIEWWHFDAFPKEETRRRFAIVE